MNVKINKKRILFISDFYHPSMGYISNFLPISLSRQGATVAILTNMENKSFFSNSDSLEDIFLGRGFLVCRDRESSIIFYFTDFKSHAVGSSVRHMADIVEDFSPSIIQSLIITTDVINVQASRIAKKKNIKIFLQDHSSVSVFYPNRRGKFWHFFFKLVLSRYLNSIISGCFYPSPDIRQIVTAKYGISANLLIYQPLGTNSEYFHIPTVRELEEAKNLRTLLEIPSSDTVFLYAGRLTAAKGTDLLLKAFLYVRETSPNSWLILLGDLLEPEIFEHFQTLPNVIILNRVHVEDLPLFYWLANFGVWPKEGSTSINDAISCGLPVIVRAGLSEPERRVAPELTFEDENWESLANVMSIAVKNSIPRNTILANSAKLNSIKDWHDLARERINNYYFPMDNNHVK